MKIFNKKINPNILVIVITVVVIALASNICGFCIMKDLFN